MKKEGTEDLCELLMSKSKMKQDVFDVTRESFRSINEHLTQVSEELKKSVCTKDNRLNVDFQKKGEFESILTLAGDAVVFHMHTNVFTFPSSHMIFKSPYVKKNETNAYCGVINMYNFLNDSFKYHRQNDSGYLVGRIFINREGHFFMEGQRELGFRYNDFTNGVLDEEAISGIILTVLKYVISFDLFTPPYAQVKEVSLGDIQELSNNLKLKTGKRLGFKFESDNDHKIDF